MVSRAERGPFADWLRTVDRWLLGSFLALMVIGLVMALLFGAEVKGSRRWIFGIQPSEFIKPAFVVLAAWAFTEGGRRTRTAPIAKFLSFVILPATIVPLILQPDFGQTMLVSIVWASLFFMAGLHWFWVVGVGGLGVLGGFAAFKLSPHVHERILRFIDPDKTGGVVDTFQVDTALQSILSGGWLGRGPGEGVYKRILPDAHTDFVFAVTGEEFGMVACLVLILFFAFIVIRGLTLSARNEDPFCRFVAAGMVVMFGVQSWINMAVNLRAMPAKGMTLPFISYGGSSLLALGLGMGFLLATTRRRPIADLPHDLVAAE